MTRSRGSRELPLENNVGGSGRKRAQGGRARGCRGKRMSKKGREARERSFRQRALEKGIVARFERPLLPPKISFTLFASFLPSPFPTPGRRKKRERERERGDPYELPLHQLAGRPLQGRDHPSFEGGLAAGPRGQQGERGKELPRVEGERVHVEPPERRMLQRR